MLVSGGRVHSSTKCVPVVPRRLRDGRDEAASGGRLRYSDARSGSCSLKTRCVYSRTISVLDRTAVSLAIDSLLHRELARLASSRARWYVFSPRASSTSLQVASRLGLRIPHNNRGS